MSTIEIIASIFGLLSVYLTVKENIWCWPTGLIMVFLYIFIFYDAKLYSDMGLQIIYVFMQFYGWYHWMYGGKKKNDLAISMLNKKGYILWSLVAIVGIGALGYSMKTYTDASFPYPDAFITIVSLVAQWFLSRKILESWILWISIDIVGIFVFLGKDLYFTTGLYAVFLFLAVKGLLEWQKTFKHQKKPA